MTAPSRQRDSLHLGGHDHAGHQGCVDRLREQRRHGDPFPLNAEAVRDFCRDANVFEPRRAQWICNSLNRLASHDANSQHFPVLSSDRTSNVVQEFVTDRICESLRMSGLPPADTSPESALRELQTAEISYDGTPNNLAAYDPDKLKVLKSQIKP